VSTFSEHTWSEHASYVPRAGAGLVVAFRRPTKEERERDARQRAERLRLLGLANAGAETLLGLAALGAGPVTRRARP
jgi:hypothetical protein